MFVNFVKAFVNMNCSHVFSLGSGIGFEKTRYFVNEPSDENKESYVKLVVLRNGDTSKTSQVRLYTKDGSAKADTDFTPLSKVSEFFFP